MTLSDRDRISARFFCPISFSLRQILRESAQKNSLCLRRTHKRTPLGAEGIAEPSEECYNSIT